MSNTRDLSILDKHIIGRVTPHIYAFSTGTVPSYLKVGDTYRPVTTRLAEWRQVFPDLESHFQAPATLGEKQDTYFRDYSVHKYLEGNGHARLERDELDEGVYYSREFFQEATPEDVEQAIEDIRSSYEANDARYALYDAASTLPQTHTYTRADTEWTLRPNQQKAVNNFQQAVAKGRTHLLMYAVMRFGKSFTSLACAKAIEAKSVVVVSAKADVLTEWKKTTEIPANFEGFRFLTTRELGNDADAITKTIANGEVPVVFLTLQDLQGSDIKERHKQVFEHQFGLLIIDESHYGARAQSYGQVLRDSGLPEESKTNRAKELEDTVDPDQADALVKFLKANVHLHLSGTPYRILMGSEFTPEDIVAFVQFSDIVQEQEAWDRNHLNEDGVNEWDNPYFGFPQMVRFAFNLNESSRARIEQLRSEGISATLSALLQPQSVKLDTKSKGHTKFKHEPEVLDLLRIIDGSQTDPNILGFLDYDKIKAGNMCRHMVMVLPYKASCDAMETLLADHAEEFKNLADYEVLNISGLATKKNLKDTEGVKAAIVAAEAKGKKTITLTVNKMLTGSTVEQWDTMLFLKDTSSPQEYDQAIFRLQNQYVRDLGVRESQEDTEDKVIRHCLKPQTLLVDFDPTRMFRMQEQKSLIYNVNTDGRGNDELEDRLKEELRISPIITLNSDLITEVKPTDILQAISNYNADRTITDEVMDLPVDLGMLKDADLRALIEAQAEIGSRQGFELKPHEGDETEADIAPPDGDDADTPGGTPDGGDKPNPDPGTKDKDQTASLEKKMRTYYQRILFFAMLAQKPVNSLGDIVETCTFGDHPRILRNLGLDCQLLARFRDQLDPFKLSQLDYKIQNINRLVNDSRFAPLDRAQRALKKFNRLSDSEVRTPSWFCDQIVDSFPIERLGHAIAKGEMILDIASKFGEFALAFVNRLSSAESATEAELIKSAIYALPTSPIAYEFTHRTFDILGIPVSHVAQDVTTYDILQFCSKHGIDVAGLQRSLGESFGGGGHHLNSETRRAKDMKFVAIVGNPPYQTKDNGAGASSRPIYHHFVDASEALAPDFDALVVPTRWFSGGKGLGDFRAKMLRSSSLTELHDFEDPSMVFEGTNNRGGICYFIRDHSSPSAGDGFHELTYVRHDRDGHTEKYRRALDPLGVGMVIRDNLAISIVPKILGKADFAPLSEIISARKPFGIESNIIKSANFLSERPSDGDYIRCIAKRRAAGYVERSMITSNQDAVSVNKVFFARANNIGTELNDNNINAFVGQIGEVCTEAYIMCGHTLNLTPQSADNLVRYLNSRFARYLHSIAKASHDATSSTFRFVPQVDVSENASIDWLSSADELDRALCRYFGLSDEETQHIMSFDAGA